MKKREYHLSQPVVLASSSPRRHELLKRLIPRFEVRHPNVEENTRAESDAEALAVRLAVRKARDVASRLKRGTVIAADTLVQSAKGEIVGKPADRDEAIRILSQLSGTRHKVVTGVCVIDVASGKEVSAADSTYVTMRRMSAEEVRRYVESGEADGKAGAYAIQETGDRYVEKVEGSLTNVVGLPLELLDRMLRELEGK